MFTFATLTYREVSSLRYVSTLDDLRWRAVESRDTSRAASFVYAVRTTGVYCRAGCASRRPRRSNVEFFVDGTQASAAGYRACVRCHPDGYAGSAISDAVIDVCRYVEESGEDVSLGEAASRVGFSEGHLRRAFRDVIGVTYASFVRERRAARVREHLRAGASVSAAAFDAGYGSVSAFYRSAGSSLGMEPARFRDGAPEELIRYTCLTTTLGVVLVASTTRGVCSVQLGRAETPLVAHLVEQYPLATIARDDDALRDVAAAVSHLARGEEGPSEVPLDIRGTAFQIRVWNALRRIPAGETRTYSEVAATIGSPSAVRAVASACAANRLALVVPCHRVVRRDGSLGGYRWGPEVKEALLSLESRDAPGRVGG